MERFIKSWNTPRTRQIVYIVFMAIMLGWVIFRFAMIISENKMDVFNPSRGAAQNGIPVNTIVMQSQSGVLREPITVQNNRAYVSASRLDKLHRGSRVGNGEIMSISRDIDLNSGMHIVRTRGVSDGLQYAEYKTDGYFVPLYAIHNGTVMVAENNIATPRTVTVIHTDAENAMVDGLADGDIVILSKVDAGQSVKLVK